MKKNIFIVILIILLLTLVGCKTYEEYVPLEEDYGSWDGYYIYYGNVRCKTTGEDEQLLVSEINYNEKNYKIDFLQYYDYIDNNIFMIVYFVNDNEETLSAFLRYNILSKTTEILFTLENHMLNDFFIKEKRYVFLKIRQFDENYSTYDYYIRYDLETNTYVSFNGYTYHQTLDDIILFRKGNIMYYMKYDGFEFCEIGILDNGISRLVTFNGKRYLLHISSNYIGNYVYYKSLSIYDFDNKKLNNLISYDDCKEFELIDNEYMIFYETKSYEYVSSIKNMQSHKYEILDHYMGVNNILSKIDYNSLTINDVYIFENKDVSYNYGYIKDNKYYIVSEKVIKGNQLIPGNVKTNKCVLDLDTLKLSKNILQKEEKTESHRNEIVLDDYIYYFETKKIAPFLGGNYVNFLYREDKTTKEVKVMQFFGYVVDEVKGTRYSELFVYAYKEEKNFEDIKILNY